MSDGRAARPAVYSIPTHRSFADSLAAGLIAKFGDHPLRLASGRILLPNNRAVRTITDAFVRASGSGLLLPRLIPIGDPELDERIGGALDPAGDEEPVPPAIEPLERMAMLAALVRGPDESAAEAMRLASELARTIDALIIEEVDPARLADAVADAPELAAHWEKALERFHSGMFKPLVRTIDEGAYREEQAQQHAAAKAQLEELRKAEPREFCVAKPTHDSC